MTVNDASLGESGSKLSKVAATSLLMGVTRASSEAYVLAFRPVVDGGDCVLQADPGIVVPDEIYRGQHFKCQGVRISVMTTQAFRR